MTTGQGSSNPTRSDRLAAVVASVLGVPESAISEDASPATVPEWDSLNHLNVVAAVEGEFGVRFLAADIVAMRDLRLIRSRLKAAGVDI